MKYQGDNATMAALEQSVFSNPEPSDLHHSVQPNIFSFFSSAHYLPYARSHHKSHASHHTPESHLDSRPAPHRAALHLIVGVRVNTEFRNQIAHRGAFATSTLFRLPVRRKIAALLTGLTTTTKRRHTWRKITPTGART